MRYRDSSNGISGIRRFAAPLLNKMLQTTRLALAAVMVLGAANAAHAVECPISENVTVTGTETIRGQCLVRPPGTLNILGTLANAGRLLNNGSIIDRGTLNNNNRLGNMGSLKLDGTGSSDHAILNNNGVLSNHGSLSVDLGILNNKQHLLNKPGASISLSPVLSNTPTFENSSFLKNSGEFINEGTLTTHTEVGNEGRFVNRAEGVVNSNSAFVQLSNGDGFELPSFRNDGSLINLGQFKARILVGNGTVHNDSDGNMSFGYTFCNMGSVVNDGVITFESNIASCFQDFVNNGELDFRGGTNEVFSLRNHGLITLNRTFQNRSSTPGYHGLVNHRNGIVVLELPTFRVPGGSSTGGGYFLYYEEFVNKGTILVKGDAGAIPDRDNAKIEDGSGNSTLRQTSGLLEVNGLVNTQSPVRIDGGILAGTGRIGLAGTSGLSSAVVRIGPNAKLSPGRMIDSTVPQGELEVVGNLQIEGTLKLDLAPVPGNVDNDRLRLPTGGPRTGRVFFGPNSSIDITCAGYVPNGPHDFQIISADRGVTGLELVDLNISCLPPGYAASLTYDGIGIVSLHIGYERNPAPMLKSGLTEANHNWNTVATPGELTDPVIIAGPPSQNGDDPGVVRLRNVQSGSFEVQFQEWDYLDGWHSAEQIPYLALAKGAFASADGTVWQVGTFRLFNTASWRTQRFQHCNAPGGPKLFLTIQSAAGAEAITVRARRVTRSGFEAALFEQESLMNGHATETIGYLVVCSPGGTGTVVDMDGNSEGFSVNSVRLDQNWRPVGPTYLKMEEEQSADPEVKHVFERVDVLQLANKIFAQDVSSNGDDTAAVRAQQQSN